MKRVLILLLMAALLLAGCAREVPEPSTPTGETESNDLYTPDSSIEQQTGGAVRTYTLETNNYFGLYSMGANLLVAGEGKLMVLSGDGGEQIAVLETSEINASTLLDTAMTGVAYYLPDMRQVVVLNPQLQNVIARKLPEGIVGNPIINLALNQVFYSTGAEIRALNLATGVSRLVRQQPSVSQELLGIYFDNTVLYCRLTDENNKVRTEYISAETGQTLNQAQGMLKMETYGENYFAYVQDGPELQLAFGTRTGEARRFMITPSADAIVSGQFGVPAKNGALTYAETQTGLTLSFYDLSTGKHAAQTLMPGLQAPEAVHCDGTHMWLLATEKQNGEQALYRWDIAKSPIEDENGYIGPLYTAANPNTEALALCREQADAFEEEFEVKLVIWQDVLAHVGPYTITPEHHPQTITQMMEELKPVLSVFPEKFLLKTVEAGWIRISLVRSIDGGQDWVQFWEDGDCYVVLSSQADVAKSLIQGIAYGIDSHVLGNSRDFDTWNQLNPEGFAYSYSNKPEEKPEYLEGENKAFADALSMCYPHEDRCRIFYNALLADNAEMFKTPIMQAKLLRVCMGIREAYGLEKKTDTYAWEQYLESSIAYVKK